ncbi:MAG: TIGR03032 family protein [Pirellulales bacterium]|nr:TIGR03032 family protein [Pirellulales bacterium]
MNADQSDVAPNAAPLRSVHTTSFARLLAETGASVLVSTYQAGKLIILRNDRGVLNTHFRNFQKPMGVAAAGGRLAVGTQTEIAEFHNVPAVCTRLDGTGPSRHDACYLPRTTHTTGDVQIHEMAWIEGELWFVNTAFSCLCARSDVNSFDLRWRPPFIDKLTPEDCCHLNGVAVREGRAAYVTALGATNTAAGWRANKRDGGVLVDVGSNEVVVRGLAMPHSPRWHGDQLWLLESGDGSLGRVDLQTGRYEAIARLPGFTRGLAFLGRVALVGLSQVRESAIFSGIPLVDRLAERSCGVWAVDIETGETLGFVRFKDAVQEICAVEALAGVRYPDLINDDVEVIGRSYVLSDDALALAPEGMRSGR